MAKASKAKDNFYVDVENVGTVYGGDNESLATELYKIYVAQSQQQCGRAAGSGVAMYHNGELIREYRPGDIGA